MFIFLSIVVDFNTTHTRRVSAGELLYLNALSFTKAMSMAAGGKAWATMQKAECSSKYHLGRWAKRITLK